MTIKVDNKKNKKINKNNQKLFVTTIFISNNNFFFQKLEKISDQKKCKYVSGVRIYVYESLV